MMARSCNQLRENLLVQFGDPTHCSALAYGGMATKFVEDRRQGMHGIFHDGLRLHHLGLVTVSRSRGLTYNLGALTRSVGRSGQGDRATLGIPYEDDSTPDLIERA